MMRLVIAALYGAFVVSALPAYADTPAPGQATIVLGTPPAATPPVLASHAIAVLQGLDKTTARVSTFMAPAGAVTRFGTLRITVRDCRKHPPEEDPETAAYLDIDEILPGQDKPIHWFSGWMFASSPAVSALEHPVYDVWVVDCKTDPTSSTP